MWDWLFSRYSPAALWGAWGTILIGYAVFLVLERLIPAQRNPTAGELATDVRANVAFILLGPISVLAGGWLSSPVAGLLGGPVFRVDLGALATGLFSAFLLAFVPLLVFDFFYYWFHRLQHQWDWLWEIHQLHHSEPALNVTTNFRHHWLEEFFRSFFILLPMNWLVALGPATSAVAALFIGQWSSFFHANIRVNLGPLTSVITGPQYHRIHHSIEPRHFRRNYAAFFPLWDWVFGTYFRPAKGEWPEVGLEGTPGVLKLREVLLLPFVGWWRRLATRLNRRKVLDTPAPPSDAR
jgi:sterol desaturase/sphingolipid hydroxylase (fatty acid hydroxylase superfamily)